MEWVPDPDALRGRVAVVAGATRGAGRGIAAALGEAGLTDLDGSQPDVGRAIVAEETEQGLDADPQDYR